MKKISKVATASVLLFTLANPLAVFAENRVGNVSEASSNKTTQDLTISSEEINGDIVFHVTAVRDTYEAILYAKINGKNYTYNLGNLKKGQVSKIVQPDASINNNNASISKESTKGRILPNTSAVRELVEKSVLCSNELNGNTIEAKVVYKVYELVEKQSTQNDGREYIPESTVKGSAIVKPEIQVKPEYKEVLGGAIVEPAVQPELPKAVVPAVPAPKAEEPAVPAPKVDEPVSPAPKVDEPTATAPKAEEPATPAPKAEEPASSAPKDDESGSSVESPSTGNHSDESGTPSSTPTGDSTATQPSDSTSSPVTPSEEAPVTSGDTNSTTQPAGETGNSETTVESSNTPSAEATNDSGNAATSTPTPEASTSEPKSEEELKMEEALKSAKKESIDDNIGEVVKIKADAIEKVTDADEKARLKEALKTLQDKAIEEINKAKDDEEVATVTEKYQNEINALDVPGEEVSSPNYGREGLTNNGPGGTTIDNGSTAIGHGASGTSRSAVATPAQPSSTSEGTSSFRNAPSVQARARRVARSTSEPDGTVNISYNFAEMPDIHGFLSDPGEDNTVTIPAGTSEAQAKELVKEKIQAKIKDLAARGYHVKNDIIFEQDTTVKNYNYVVTFTKETTGTSGFRMAPAVQPRASRNRRSLEQPAPQKVKVNVFYNFDQMKDIAGFLGDINGTPLEVTEGSTNEQVKEAVKSQVDAKKEELSKRGYTFKEDYVYQANGKDYNYVVTFSKAAK